MSTLRPQETEQSESTLGRMLREAFASGSITPEEVFAWGERAERHGQQQLSLVLYSAAGLMEPGENPRLGELALAAVLALKEASEAQKQS